MLLAAQPAQLAQLVWLQAKSQMLGQSLVLPGLCQCWLVCCFVLLLVVFVSFVLVFVLLWRLFHIVFMQGLQKSLEVLPMALCLGL